MTAILVRLGAAFLVAGIICCGFSALTLDPVFGQFFWEVVRGALVLALILAAGLAVFAGLVLGGAWLLLSDRSPIPSVRARWTRHLTPVRAASQTARCAATTQKDAS